MDVLSWIVASAGDGGGEKHSMGEDAKESDVFARNVSTTDVALGCEAIFELLIGPGRWDGVAEPSDCLE